MIIEAADAHGIYIPRFCYHHKLSIVANCRMCLVEVSTVRKPVPACATPVTQDMKVFTMSEAAMQSQRTVMEFLLINHPLDCPICDQGGECELQDLAMGFGNSYSYFDQKKRAVASEDIGPLVETEMTRCIHCTRCVRFGEEIAGLRELGVTFRGEGSEIGTYVKHFMKSELSGNIIDLCPVGALTAKPSRYSERAWTLKEKPSIAPHDCVGSNIYINTRSQEYAPQETVMRVNPRANEAVNECWISDRDRFSYEGLHHADRVLKPRMKKNGQWVEAEWKYVLMAIADRIQAIAGGQSPDEIAALVSPNSTVEECYLMQKLLRSLGSNNIDHRLREMDFSDQHLTPVTAHLGISLSDLETVDAVLLIGSMVRYQQPLIAHRINKAYQEGARVMAINPVDYQFTFAVSECIVDADLVARTAEVAKALADLVGKPVAALSAITPSEAAQKIATTLKDSNKTYVMLGDIAVQHPQAAYLRQLVRTINDLIGCAFGMTTDGANSAGAHLAGAVPHRGVAAAKLEQTGSDAYALLSTDPKRAYFLLNIEPEYDVANPNAALNVLKEAGCVVCMTPFATEAMASYADFILPIAPFSETAGTFVNAEGEWQRFAAATVPKGDAKPAWKILRVLANFLQLDGFDYQTSHEIHDEVKVLAERLQKQEAQPLTLAAPPQVSMWMTRLASPHQYRNDNLVRRAQALQDCMSAEDFAISFNSNTAAAMSIQKEATSVEVTQGDQKIKIAIVIDARIADGVVVLPAALEETAGFGMAFGEVTCI